MLVTDFIGIIQTIGSIVGAISGIIAFIALLGKRPKQWLEDTIQIHCKSANAELENAISNLLNEQEAKKQRDLVMIRHQITQIYNEYKERKKLPMFVREDLFSLLEEYDKLHGNYYVHNIAEEMKKWSDE